MISLRPITERRSVQWLYVFGLQAFLAVGHDELNPLPFKQYTMPFAANCSEVHENIFTLIP